MSKKVDKKYVYNKDDDDADDEEEDRKCPPPQFVTPPEFIPNMAARVKENIQEIDMEVKKAAAWTLDAATEEEEDQRKCPSTKPVPSQKPDEEWTAAAQKDNAAAIKEAVFLDEKEEVNPNKLLVSNEDRNTARRTFGGQPDYSLGAEVVDIQRWPCPNATEQRPRQTLPGAY